MWAESGGTSGGIAETPPAVLLPYGASRSSMPLHLRTYPTFV